MTKDTEETINLLNSQINNENKGISFDTYQRVYAVTNENLDGVFSSIDLSSIDKALTVTASGDHAFNLITKGVLNIDTFDSNIITNYYAFGLKKAAILKYNYHDYLTFIKNIFSKSISIEKLYQLLTDLLPYMEKEYRDYWKNLISYGYKNSLNIMLLMCFNLTDLENKSNKNNYLINEENYNALKRNLSRSNITFTHANYFELEKLDKKYDLLYFSNIADYFYRKFGYNWKYEELLKEYIRISSISKKDAQIIISYLYKCYHNDTMNHYLFSASNATTEDLQDEEIVLFDSIVKDKRLTRIKDGILIKRN